MKKLAGILLLSTQILIIPAMAAPRPDHDDDHHNRDRDRRYYVDPYRHDRHEWNESEARAYRHWLMEERRERQYRDYNRINAERQREYWQWRHEHPDWR